MLHVAARAPRRRSPLSSSVGPLLKMDADKTGRRFQFFELTSPVHLFEKILGDLAALEASAEDSRLAFTFFVSVEHLPDWLGLRHLVRAQCILRIVSHIANGAKHFMLRDARHRSVVCAERSGYVEAGYVEPGYFEEPLVVYLSEDEARELGTTEVDVVSLARKAVEFWRPYVEAAQQGNAPDRQQPASPPIAGG